MARPARSRGKGSKVANSGHRQELLRRHEIVLWVTFQTLCTAGLSTALNMSSDAFLVGKSIIVGKANERFVSW